MTASSVQREIERIASDESWQSNLTDDEKKTLLEWCEQELTARLESERERIAWILGVCNRLCGVIKSVERETLIATIIESD